jgi:hypothetical protein
MAGLTIGPQTRVSAGKQVIRQAFTPPEAAVYQSPAEWQRDNWKIDPPESAIFVVGKGM